MTRSLHPPGAVAALCLFALSAAAGDWPQWRGPARDGVWRQDGLPDSFPEGGLKARWRVPVGGGYGGVAATNGRVYLMDRQKDPREVERVLCLDAADGKLLWKHEYPVAYGKMEFGNGPRATPAVHDGRVYAFGALGHFHCLDAADGKPVWACDTAKAFDGAPPTWGHASSPLVDGDRVVVQVGGRRGACLVALDRKTGKEVWRALGDRPGYSSPVMMDLPGGRQLVYWAAENLSGLDPATGKVLWQAPHTTNYDVTIADPVGHGGTLLVSDYWEGSKAVRLDEKGRGPKVAWEGKPLSLLMSTPLVRDGHAYALDRFNGLKCVELETGKVKWEGEHVTPRGRNPHASLVWAGERALILNEKGELILARLSPEGYKPLGKVKVIDETWAHPGFLDGCVFARNDKEIVCVPLTGK
jgi:outer membrane protein assembly factor BamB